AVQALYGAEAAFDVHRGVLAAPGHASEQTVFDVARARGLEVARIGERMSDADVKEALRAQRRLAIDSRFRFTPTFVMAGVAFVGWPGASTLLRFAAATRKCGALQCNDAPASESL
ncbi:MAG: DsbA family protein, partial [Hyphomicrobiales bacterium]|nr:DsbA family protein [Hyphomicrobiales bacterium]